MRKLPGAFEWQGTLGPRRADLIPKELRLCVEPSMVVPIGLDKTGTKHAETNSKSKTPRSARLAASSARSN